MAEATKRRPYVSCIKSFGRPILPPLMTDEKRLLMRHFKAVACEREAARAQRKQDAFLCTSGDLSSPDSSLGVVHSAPPSLATSGDPSPMLSPLVVARLERDEQWAVSDTPETGSSATLVPSSSDSETGGTSTMDSVGSQLDKVEDKGAGYPKDTPKPFPEVDLVPGIQDEGTEVREASTETTPAMPPTPTPRQHVQSAPTTPTMMQTMLPAIRVELATTPKTPVMRLPVTAPVTLPKTPVTMTVTAQNTLVVNPATMPTTTPPGTPRTPARRTSTTPATTMPLSPETPVMVTVTTEVTPTTTPTTTETLPLSLPDRDICFPTKVSVPSLCRSRSFVVDSPSLAQLLLRGLRRDGSDGVNGTAVKIVQPCNSQSKTASSLSPASSERHACATRAEARVRKTKVLKMSKTFVKDDSEVDSLSLSSQVTGADESSPQIGDAVQLQSDSVCVQSAKQQEAMPTHSGLNFYAFGGKKAGCPRGSPPFAEPTVPESPYRVEQASTLPGKWDCADERLISRAFGDTLKSFAKINRLAAHKTMDNSCNVSFDNSSKVTGRVVPWTFSAFDMVAATKEPESTLRGIPNVPGDDSGEETVADDVFIDALNDSCTEVSSPLLPNFFTKDSAATAGTLPSDWDQGGINFVPASTSSNRQSICSSTSSIYSSSCAEHDVLALTLNSSGDVEEDEEQYENTDEPRGDQANSFAELAGSIENSGSSLDESSASSGSERLKSLDQHMSAADMLSAHELKLQALCQTIARDYAKVDWSTTTALHKEAVTIATEEERSDAANNAPLEVQTASSTSPASMEGPSGHVSPLADLSVLQHSDADHSRLDSSLASMSIHLDLLSETRQSLHPKWRRCFDRLTAMARGHLTRRLMKTHRVQSIIQTIKDTLECALRLHVEPHICSGLVTPQDVELHQRLITQLTSACHELHDVFFDIPVSERMQLISQLRSQKARPPLKIAKSCMEQAPKKISLATQKVLERRLSKLTGRGQNLKVEVKRPTAVVRSQTFVATASADTCHTAGAAPSGTTRKICRLPMYKV